MIRISYIATAKRCGGLAVKTECRNPTILTTKSKMSDTTEMMNANETIAPVVAEQPKKAPVRRVIQTKKPVVVAPPPKAPTPPASEDEAESSASESEAESSADEAPAPAPTPKTKMLPMVEYKRLLEIEKLYNEMKPKYEVFVKKDIEKKAKANEASKRSKAKKSKETKEVKAKLEERVEKLEKLVIKTEVVEEEAEESDAEAEDEE